MSVRVKINTWSCSLGLTSKGWKNCSLEKASVLHIQKADINFREDRKEPTYLFLLTQISTVGAPQAQ